MDNREIKRDDSCEQSLKKLGRLSHVLKRADELMSRFSELEHHAVRLAKVGGVVDQPVDYRGVLAKGDILEKELSYHKPYSAVYKRRIIKKMMIGLQYRLEKANGGLDHTVVNSIQLDTLIDLAIRWKTNQKLVNVKILTGEDVEQLKEAATYPVFVDLVVEDDELRQSFFHWILRDRLSVGVFIQFPDLQAKIVEAAMNGRIGSIGGHLLSIKNREVAAGIDEKVVTLPFEGKEVSLLDEGQVVTFRGHYSLTIKEIFDHFKAKAHSVGNLEMLDQGIMNWNAHLLGWWDADRHEYQQVDFSRPAWWEDLPITTSLTVKQASKRYKVELDGIQWVVAACATRSHTTLAPIGSHAFLEVAIPTPEGRYHLYSFGKFSYKWATTPLESLIAFTDVHYATIAYPDENIYFTNRQHAQKPFVITPEMGIPLMDGIKEDMLSALTHNLIYQWEGDNCAKWVQDKLEKHIDSNGLIDLRTPMLDSQPSDASRYLFAMLKQLPNILHSPILSALHYPLGAWRGKWVSHRGKKVWTSLTSSHFWDQKVVYLPARIHLYNEGVASRAATPQLNPEAASTELVLNYAAAAHRVNA